MDSCGLNRYLLVGKGEDAKDHLPPERGEFTVMEYKVCIRDLDS